MPSELELLAAEEAAQKEGRGAFGSSARAIAVAVLKAAEDVRDGGLRRVRHVKRGSEYFIVGQALLQSNKELKDMEQMVVYRADDGTLWVRPLTEFEDGRFVPV